MMCQASQDAVALVDWVTQAMLRSANIISWLLLAVLLAVLPGCGAKVDLAAERHAKAVKALIDLGAEVRHPERREAVTGAREEASAEITGPLSC